MLLADLFEQCRCALSSGDAERALAILRLIDRDSLSFNARKLFNILEQRTREITSPLIQKTLHTLDAEPPKAGVSLVTACMNRQSNLLKAIPSWLETTADQIIVVDWSSKEPVAPLLAHINDPRLVVVRIQNEKHWILTHAFNVGLRIASYEMVFKLDADIQLAPDFLERNRFSTGEFVRGFWKSAVDAGEPDQRYINGSFGALKADLRSVGYYNERILTYGWDDSDLYARLSNSLGKGSRALAHNSLHHLEQDESQRLENQTVAKDPVLGCFASTQRENLVNKFHELNSQEWGVWMPAQDYQLTKTSLHTWHGTRITTVPFHRPEERDLASLLAMRQLATWRNDLLPKSSWQTAVSLEFARLLKQAQEQGIADRLINAFEQRGGLHFVSAEPGALRHACEKTMSIVFSHLPADSSAIIVLADDGFRLGEHQSQCTGVLHASQVLIDELALVFNATQRTDLQNLEDCLADSTNGGCTIWRFTVATLVASAIAHANTIAENLKHRFVRALVPATHTALATSVYDETNLLRMLEYLACVALNLEAVEYLLLMYEARNGLFQLAIQALCQKLVIEPARVSLQPFDKRPTFHELFSLQRLLPEDMLFVVANADVTLDASLTALALNARDDHFYVLSRWDIDDSGCNAKLIRLECGAPNVFSADAWIARTPVKPDFFLDYPIGTFHCDSFINHQLSRSLRYRWANPCLDVHVFHLHNSRFNSSEEKYARDREIIQQGYAVERARNGDVDPIRGTPWGSLAQSHIANKPEFLINWHTNFLVLDFTQPQAQISGILWLNLLTNIFREKEYISIVIHLREADLHGPLGKVLAQYKVSFNLRVVQFEMDDTKHRECGAPNPEVQVSHANPSSLLAIMEESGIEAWASSMHELMACPLEGSSVNQIRCEFPAALNTSLTRRLNASLRSQQPASHAELIEFLSSLDRFSEEGMMFLPFLEDLANATPTAPALLSLETPKVSFITSLFRGGEFLEGYLENVAEAAMIAAGEVIIIDANCDGYDTEALDRFFKTRPELRSIFQVVQLESDPGLYSCWQIAIERSRGEYLSNANLDDRRSPQHTRRLIKALDARPHLVGAAGSISAVSEHASGGWFDLLPNQVWFEELGEREFGFDDLYIRNHDGSVRSHNIMHCMPVWRRSLHDRYGFFDEALYGTSADWAFWLRCAQAGERLWFDSHAFGRYFINPESHNRRNDMDGTKEKRIIKDFLDVSQSFIAKQ